MTAAEVWVRVYAAAISGMFADHTFNKGDDQRAQRAADVANRAVVEFRKAQP